MKRCLYFLLVLLVVGQSSCRLFESSKASTPPNIVWINAEDISPALGCYGDEYATTPNIDRLATNGLLYQHAYATAPICSPSRSCLASRRI